MQKISLEMPIVQRCDVTKCGYNSECTCHAKAITIGDYSNPGCDTFLDSASHTKNTQRMAGVGACKVSNCQYNNDFECTVHEISVGFNGQKVNCLTFKSRS